MAVTIYKSEYFLSIVPLNKYLLHLCRLEPITKKMQFENAYSFLIDKLEKELSPNLFYHNVQHTKDVLNAAELLGKAVNLSDYELTILKTAALFHDAGFIEAYDNHEYYSEKIAKEFLPQFEYNEEQIRKVCELIAATKMPQSPQDKLAEILCDADLFYLGTDNFVERSENLYKELHTQNLFRNRKDWVNNEMSFLLRLQKKGSMKKRKKIYYN